MDAMCPSCPVMDSTSCSRRTFQCAPKDSRRRRRVLAVKSGGESKETASVEGMLRGGVVEKAVIVNVAVAHGGRESCGWGGNVGEGRDKGVVRAREGVYGRPGVVIGGDDEVGKGVMVDDASGGGVVVGERTRVGERGNGCLI